MARIPGAWASDWHLRKKFGGPKQTTATTTTPKKKQSKIILTTIHTCSASVV